MNIFKGLRQSYCENFFNINNKKFYIFFIILFFILLYFIIKTILINQIFQPLSRLSVSKYAILYGKTTQKNTDNPIVNVAIIVKWFRSDLDTSNGFLVFQSKNLQYIKSTLTDKMVLRPYF